MILFTSFTVPSRNFSLTFRHFLFVFFNTVDLNDAFSRLKLRFFLMKMIDLRHYSSTGESGKEGQAGSPGLMGLPGL